MLEFVWSVGRWVSTNLGTIADIVSLATAAISLTALVTVFRIKKQLMGRVRLRELRDKFIAHRTALRVAARSRSRTTRLEVFSHLANCGSDLNSLKAYVGWRQYRRFLRPVNLAIEAAKKLDTEQRADSDSDHIWTAYEAVSGLVNFLENEVRDSELGG